MSRCNPNSIEKEHDYIIVLFLDVSYYFKISQSSWVVSATKSGFSANKVSLVPNPQVTAIVLMPTVFPPIKSNLVSPTMTELSLFALFFSDSTLQDVSLVESSRCGPIDTVKKLSDAKVLAHFQSGRLIFGSRNIDFLIWIVTQLF